MSKLFKTRLFIQVVMATLVATLATVGIVAATTTIGTSINTGGTLTVTSTTATSTISTGGLTVGTNQFVVQQTSGNVGIGTSSPAQVLDVWGNLQVGTSSTPTLFVNTANGKVGVGTTNPYGVFNIYGNGNSTTTGPLLTIGAPTAYGLYNTDRTAGICTYLHIKGSDRQFGAAGEDWSNDGIAIEMGETFDSSRIVNYTDAGNSNYSALGIQTHTNISGTWNNGLIMTGGGAVLLNVPMSGMSYFNLNGVTPVPGVLVVNGTIAPWSNGITDIGSNSYQFRAIYTNQLKVSSTTVPSYFSGKLGIVNTSPTYNLDITGNAHITTFVDAANFVATSTSVASTFAYRVGIGTTTPTTQLQVTIPTANATSTLTVGKASQNKGSCLELFDSAGTAVYAYVAAGGTTFTLSAVSCK